MAASSGPSTQQHQVLTCDVTIAMPSESAASIAATSVLPAPAKTAAASGYTCRAKGSTVCVTVRGSSARDVRMQCHAVIDQLRLIVRTLQAFDVAAEPS